MQVLLMLLWALLKAGMVSDVLSVLSVSLTHKIVVSVVLIFLFYPSVQSKCASAVRPAVQKGALFCWKHSKVLFQITFAVGLRVDAELIPLFPPPLQPTHEFLLALFNHVREKDLSGLVPELMQLTFKVS